MRNYKQYDEKVLRKLQLAQLEILKDFIRICDKYDLTYFMYAGSAIGVVRHNGFIPWDDDVDVAMSRSDYDKFMEVYENEVGSKYRILTPYVDSNYTASVTHFQKNGTRFISEVSKDLKTEMTIDIDIFPFDYAPNDEKQYKRQVRQTRFLYRLLFLVGHSKPIIPMKGWKKYIAQSVCFITHYILKLFRVSGTKIYDKADKISRKYNDIAHSKRLVCYQSAIPDKSYLLEDEFFPVKQLAFEDTVVSMPNAYDVQLKRMYGDYMKLPEEKDRINHAPNLIDFGDGDIVIID
ncbi:hypothetical protein A4S06_08305 [Erysipelotrichaceae bacterium MTC7]|nr:hypothetical protein A4S06_08305 [Erysipelotrichaceae bacterium MTC7]